MPISPDQVIRGLLRRLHVPQALGFREVIYLIGPTGNPNYGDELVAATWLRFLARERPHATVVLDCHSPGQASLLLRGLHPRLVVVDTLWKLAIFAADEANAPGPDRAGTQHGQTSWDWVAAAATNPGIAPRLSEGIELLNQASTIHLIGGGYLNAIWPHHVSLFVAAGAVAARTGARAVATGQGLVPKLEEPAWSALIGAAEHFTVFDVRDEASLNAMSEIASIGNSGDDVWLALHRPPPTLYRRAPATTPRVLLCLQSDLTESFRGAGAADTRMTGSPSTGTQALADYVTAILDDWAVDGPQVTVIEAIPGHDYEVPALLGPRLAGATVIPFRDVWRYGLPASDGDTWISTRFHPHLLAAANGAAGVAISAMRGYYSTKHESLIGAGSRWTLVTDGEHVPARPVAPGFDAAHRESAIEAKVATARAIYPRSLATSPLAALDGAADARRRRVG